MRTIAFAVAILMQEVSGSGLKAGAFLSANSDLQALKDAEAKALDELDVRVEALDAEADARDKEAAKDGASDEAKKAADQAEKEYEDAVERKESAEEDNDAEEEKMNNEADEKRTSFLQLDNEANADRCDPCLPAANKLFGSDCKDTVCLVKAYAAKKEQIMDSEDGPMQLMDIYSCAQENKCDLEPAKAAAKELGLDFDGADEEEQGGDY